MKTEMRLNDSDKLTIFMRLSKSAIEDCRAKRLNVIRDTEKPTLYFRFSKNRERGSFYLVKRPGNGQSPIWLPLGQWPTVTVNDAREAHDIKMKLLMIDGESESGEVKRLRSVNELVAWFTARRRRERHLSKHTMAVTEANMKRAAYYIGDVLIADVNRQLLDERLYQPMLTSFRLSTIAATLKSLKTALSQAHRLRLVASNPLQTITLKTFSTKSPAGKDGRLTDSGIKPLLKALKKKPLQTRFLVCWLLMHGTRIGETVQASVERMSGGNWLIRSEESKTDAHVVPLTGIAMHILNGYRQNQRKAGYRGQYLFPQKQSSRKHISGSHGSNMVRATLNRKVSPHDLRKMARTWWTENGVDYYIGELLIGHKPKGLDQVYIQTIAIGQCREALTKWHAHLVKLGLLDLFE